jgi:acetoin utilization deacetylase AcuC-like enzyme
MIDADTVASPGSWEAALRAAGAACEAAERLVAGEARAAFCGARPPGHHAERARAMGFCLFNNVAAASAHALRSSGVERVLVVDWDVHHGNGTEQIFKESDEVLYVSIHQSPLYPGTGAAEYWGEGPGEGYTINLPVAPGADERVFAALLEHVVRPVALAYEPGLIALSAGFDAHRADPLASCVLESSSYERLAAGLAAVAAELEAPVLACLEGGYDHQALAESVPALLRGLDSPRQLGEAERALAEPYLAKLHPRWRA